MKRILSLLLMLIILLGLCACGNRNDPDATAPGEPVENHDISNAIKVSQNEELQLLEYYNIGDLQGKIKNTYKHYTYYAFEVDGNLYEYDSATDVGVKDEYIIYDISKYNSVISYNENVIVVDDEDGNLIALATSKKDKKKHTVTISPIKLKDIKTHELWQCKADEKENWISVVYKKDNQIMYSVQKFNGDVIQAGNINDIMDEEDQEFRLCDYLVANSGELFALNEKRELRTFEFRVWKDDNKKYNINCYLIEYNFDQFNNWTRFVKLDHSFQWAVIHSDNDALVKFYIRTGKWPDQKMELVDTIQMPESYKAQDIAETYEVLNATIVVFADGEYYKLDHSFNNQGFNRAPYWEKLSGLTKVAKDKEVATYGPWITIAESDGKVYTYNHV